MRGSSNEGVVDVIVVIWMRWSKSRGRLSKLEL